MEWFKFFPKMEVATWDIMIKGVSIKIVASYLETVLEEDEMIVIKKTGGAYSLYALNGNVKLRKR